MKKMKNIEEFNNNERKTQAPVPSGDRSEISNGRDIPFSEAGNTAEKYWKELENMQKGKKINVDKAWNNLNYRIKEEVVVRNPFKPERKYSLEKIIRIAAVFILTIGLALAALYLNNSGFFTQKLIAETDGNHNNVEVLLPDGSKVVMNYNTRLAYPKKFGTGSRQVKLTGEALFDITHDASKPFIIDAGEAKIKVLGTTFNVITNNDFNAVEVFVSNGKVLLSDNIGKQNLTLDPGYLGTMNSETSEKRLNSNQNYLSWNTNLLVYKGENLGVVFNDLKRVHNIEIVADNSEILDKTISTTFDNQSQETIISLICITFNLNSQQEGNVYHLSKK